tara:strand:+ start:2862 stop:3269 length:408 start_codon:yes stop_codon:yes gene_type:complete
MEPDQPNLDDYVSTYNKRNVNNLIYVLKQELEEQEQTKFILTKENAEKNVSTIKNFIVQNEGEIDHQLTEIESISKKMTEIINSNIELRGKEGEYIELLKEDRSIQLAKKLARIKKLKTDMQLFLSNQGIIIPNI